MNFRLIRSGDVLLRALLVALPVVVSSTARAQAGPFPNAADGGFSLNSTEPAPAGDRFFLVPDAYGDPATKDPEAIGLRAMVFGHYATTPPFTRTDPAGATTNVIEKQLYVHANLAFFATSWLHLHADLPIAAVQEGVGADAPKAGVGDLRLGARFGLIGSKITGFNLAPGVMVWVPTGSPADVTGDGQPRVEPHLNLSGKIGVFVYSGKVGYQFRKHVVTGLQSAEVGSSLTVGAALGLSLFDDVFQIGPELSGAFLTESDTDRAFASSVSPMSVLFGARVQLGDVNLGAGYGIPTSTDPAPGVAQRIFASLAFSPKTKVEVAVKATAEVRSDSDGDGVLDGKDACPNDSGEANEDPAKNGCPYSPTAEIDSDGDGILDGADACPERYGEAAEDPKLNGCPKVKAPAVTDGDGDGVLDSADACPKEAGVPEATAKTKKGCPEPVVATVPAPQKTTPGRPTATLIGVRQLEGQAVLVYVNLTKPVSAELSKKGKRLTYTLPGTAVTLKNNRNPLIATHFESVLGSARLVAGKGKTELLIDLRVDAEPIARVVNDEQGAILEVELRPIVRGADAPSKP